MSDPIVEDIKKLKCQVGYCLEKYEETRNSDKSLCIAVLQQFYGIENSITMDQFFDVPSFEGIARIRRKFQEGGFFPPTDEKVALERGWRQDDWQKAMGYFVADPNQPDLFGYKKREDRK